MRGTDTGPERFWMGHDDDGIGTFKWGTRRSGRPDSATNFTCPQSALTGTWLRNCDIQDDEDSGNDRGPTRKNARVREATAK